MTGKNMEDAVKARYTKRPVHILGFSLLIIAELVSVGGCVQNTERVGRSDAKPGDSDHGGSTHDLVIDFIVTPDTASKENFRLFLLAGTKEQYQCTNYALPYQISDTSDVVTIAIGNPVAPQMCLTALGPATCQIEVPLIADSLLVVVSWKGLTDSFVVSTVDEAIVVKPIQQAFSAFGGVVYK